MPSSVYLFQLAQFLFFCASWQCFAPGKGGMFLQSDLSFFANFSRSPLLTCDTPCLFICFKLISSDCFNTVTVDL